LESSKGHKIAAGAGLTVAGCLAYLLLWPVPAEPVSWTPQQAPGYVGAHAPNTRLAGLQKIDIGAEQGPEHLAIGPDGKLYAAVAGGKILRMAPDGSQREVFAGTGGRVLGFDFDAGGRLIAADAMKGLLAITPDGNISVLATQVAPGDPIRYADGVVVAPGGMILFHRCLDPLRPRRVGRHLRSERAGHP
jgi:hypothetical protein